MIEITRINGESMVLNCDLIESLEATPDTIIRLTSGKTIVVLESVKEVVEKVIAFRRKLHTISVAAPVSESDEASADDE